MRKRQGQSNREEWKPRCGYGLHADISILMLKRFFARVQPYTTMRHPKHRPLL